MNCKNCGNILNDNAEFCENCGTPISPFEGKAEFQAPTPVAENKPFDKNCLPAQYRPLGAWAYFGLKILFSIPIVGFVFLIVFSFSRGNLNRRSFARSYWCELILGAVLMVAIIVLVFVLGISAETFSNFMYNI